MNEDFDDTYDDVHCMPMYGPKHETSKDCWCEPELKEDLRDQGGKRLWLHKELQ